MPSSSVDTTPTYRTDLDPIVKSVDWSFSAADTRYCTHSIHRYSGKFIPQIAQRVLELVSAPGEKVLDPYCGSGTLLLEAGLMGRRAIGIDLSPLAVLISQVKCRQIPTERLLSMRDCLRDSLPSTMTDDDQQLLFDGSEARVEPVHDEPRLRDAWYTKWFQSHVLRDLVLIDREVRSLEDIHTRDVALVALSDTLRRVSNAHSGYPNVMFDKRAPRKPHPIPLFFSRLAEICARIEDLNSRKNFVTPDVKRGDARNIELTPNSVDAVVTHPPYIGSIPYAEYGSLSLKWLGHDPKELDRSLTGGKRQSRDVVDRFSEAYAAMLRESIRVLCPGRCLFILIGDPVVKGVKIDLREMTMMHAASAGFEPVAEARRNGMNRRSNQMGHEHLLFFKKPI